jgi:hypothetical protein
MQVGELGDRSIPLTFPEGWLLDDEGNSIRQTAIAPSDIAAVLLGLGVATLDLTCNHSSFTLNNLIACLIATDILQAIPTSPDCSTCYIFGMLVPQAGNGASVADGHQHACQGASVGHHQASNGASVERLAESCEVTPVEDADNSLHSCSKIGLFLDFDFAAMQNLLRRIHKCHATLKLRELKLITEFLVHTFLSAEVKIYLPACAAAGPEELQGGCGDAGGPGALRHILGVRLAQGHRRQRDARRRNLGHSDRPHASALPALSRFPGRGQCLPLLPPG